MNKKEHNSLHFIFSDAAARENIKVNDCIGYICVALLRHFRIQLSITLDGGKTPKIKGARL